MRMAFILFDDMTTLDFSGFHNAVTWLKKRNILEDLSWDYCSNKEVVKDDRGMSIQVDHVLPDLSVYDLIFIPGGIATRQLIHDPIFIDWIRTAQEVEYKVSVCTGALLLGAAGLTKDKTITTNPLALDLLEPYCKEVVKVRAMRNGDVFTGGGITASIDLGLFFIEAITNKEVVQEIQTYMDYPYYNL
ncbi:DJ-1/PfpI family protein [Paenibacillus sp. OV219]|uniref:DJ-1/PfpI family protein n=1 Tax=Paenibacillus sp. OV219 TaxID=1884377 RepID=UPI0008B3F501|nr:DJ-1/PfpI family protein [Paenibacillus sp. OV219]SEO55383.1 cyclohexyl-isocyanide hydratase [Paenibacillus sp. OV219]